MHKLTILLMVLLTLTIGVLGQNPFRNVANNFNKNNQFFSSELSKRTISLYLKQKQPDAEVEQVLRNIDNLKIVSFGAKNETDIEQFIAQVKTQYVLSEYIPFKVNSSGINNQLIYIKEENELISDLLVINTDYSQVSMVEISGDIDLKKVALLQHVLKIEGLESLELINHDGDILKSKKKREPSKYPFAIGENYFLPYRAGGVSVYNRWGSKLIDTQDEPSLLINGYLPRKDFNTTMLELNSDCIQSINVVSDKENDYPNGHIDVMLKGDVNTVYTVCDGVLYFGQNGYLHCYNINDECSPSLLYECSEKPLSAILQMEPERIKSIELTSDPRNCEGMLEGEYVVVEFR